MSPRPFRGLQDIRTATSRTREAKTPQTGYLRLANLELKRSLCDKVREAAQQRIAEMDRQIADIEGEEAEVLMAIHAYEQGMTGQWREPREEGDGASGEDEESLVSGKGAGLSALVSARQGDAPGRQGFTLKY